MAKYFRITEIDAATFERMTGDELDCLQVAMLADDGNVYVAVDEDGHDCIDVDLEMFDDIGGGPLIEERIHNRCTALSVLEELDSAPTIDAVPVRHGHWIMNEYDELYCSICGDIASLDSGEYFYRGKIRFDESFYCPNCGAKMDEVNE